MKPEAREEVRGVGSANRIREVTNHASWEKAPATYYQVRRADGGVDYVPGELLEPVEALDAMDSAASASKGRACLRQRFAEPSHLRIFDRAPPQLRIFGRINLKGFLGYELCSNT